MNNNLVGGGSDDDDDDDDVNNDMTTTTTTTTMMMIEARHCIGGAWLDGKTSLSSIQQQTNKQVVVIFLLSS